MDNTKTCKICNSLEGKYTCPKCNILYCSLVCYKNASHSQCSEQFYQQCVREELSMIEGDKEAKKKMGDILKNVHRQFDVEDEDESDENNDSDDGEEFDNDLAKRLEGIDLDDCQAVWERLTDEERKEFSEMIESGKIRDTITESDPWWISGEKVPKLASDIPSLSSLTVKSLLSGSVDSFPVRHQRLYNGLSSGMKALSNESFERRLKAVLVDNPLYTLDEYDGLGTKPPSSALPYHVMNTLMAYQTMEIILKGETEPMVIEAATGIWNLSSSLRNPACSINTLAQAFSSFLEDAKKCPWMEDYPIDCEKMAQDLRNLTAFHSCWLLQALSEIKRIFDEALTASTSSECNHQRFTGASPRKLELKKASKKVLFFLAWAKEMDDDEWDRIVGNPITMVEPV